MVISKCDGNAVVFAVNEILDQVQCYETITE